MEIRKIVSKENEFYVKDEKVDVNSFYMELDELDEMEPMESPAFIWGKWNFAGS